MAKTFKIISIVDGQPTFKVLVGKIWEVCKPGGAIKVLDPLEYITYQQIKWLKGVLLPALSNDTGDSVAVWEARLKRNVMPDDFLPTVVQDGTNVYITLPSITTLGKRKMGELIGGSVDHLRDENIYGDKFHWVTLPCKELRK